MFAFALLTTATALLNKYPVYSPGAGSSVDSCDEVRPALPVYPSAYAALLDRANLTGLVLGYIEAKFCKKICV